MTASAEIRAAVKAGRAHPVIELILDGTLHKFAAHGVCSLSKGRYVPDVRDIGDVSQMANPTEGTLEVPTFDFSIYDSQRVLQMLFGGPLRGAVKNSPIERWWRSFDVAEANHFRRFAGVIKNYEVEDRLFRFQARADVSGFERPVAIPNVPEEDWPDAPESTKGAPLWVVLGDHSSAGITESHGMIKCLPAVLGADGETCDTWIAALAANKAIPNVYIGEDLRTTDFAASQVLRARNYYHIVTYTGGNPHPTKDDDVRVDIQGLTTDPDGGGALIENPAAQMRLFLAVFGYGAGDVRPLASWESETGKPIDSDVWDAMETSFTELAWKGTLVAYAGQTLREIFEGWCQSYTAGPYFTDAGGLAASVRNPGVRQIFYPDQLVSQKLGHVAPQTKLAITTQRQEQVTDIELGYLMDEARQQFARSGLVAWRKSGITPSSEPFDLRYGKRVL